MIAIETVYYKVITQDGRKVHFLGSTLHGRIAELHYELSGSSYIVLYSNMAKDIRARISYEGDQSYLFWALNEPANRYGQPELKMTIQNTRRNAEYKYAFEQIVKIVHTTLFAYSPLLGDLPEVMTGVYINNLSEYTKTVDQIFDKRHDLMFGQAFTATTSSSNDDFGKLIAYNKTDKVQLLNSMTSQNNSVSVGVRSEGYKWYKTSGARIRYGAFNPLNAMKEEKYPGLRLKGASIGDGVQNDTSLKSYFTQGTGNFNSDVFRYIFDCELANHDGDLAYDGEGVASHHLFIYKGKFELTQ